MKILFFGDVVGKIGRKAIVKILPELKKEYEPDLIIANGENIAHGVGVTEKTLQELINAGVEVFTSGNHIFDKPEADQILANQAIKIVRPANYPPMVAGKEYLTVSVGSREVLIINLLGRVFMRENFDCPFRKIDQILEATKSLKPSAVIVDFHAEATSEKVALGWYLDGRVSAVLGTHTHVPTADAKLLPQKTAYVSDVGMVGATDSVIGVKKEPIIANFLQQTGATMDIPEEGETQVNAVMIEVDPSTGLAVNIFRVDKMVKV